MKTRAYPRVNSRFLNRLLASGKSVWDISVSPPILFRFTFFPERQGKMQIWLDVQTGIVLKMTAEIPFGPAEVILSGHKDSPLDEK